MACLRSFSTHQARSSNLTGSNSKFFKRGLERNAFTPIFRLKQALFHFFAFEQVGRFFFSSELTPKFNRHNHSRWRARLVRNVLNACLSHFFVYWLNPSCSTQPASKYKIFFNRLSEL